MKIGMIKDATSVAGEDQGYFGLPLRQEPIHCTVNGPDTPSMLTAWYPTDDEILALTMGAPVLLRVLGTVHPPVSIEVGVRSDARECGPLEQEPSTYGKTREGRPIPRPEPADVETARQWIVNMDYAALEQAMLDTMACGGNRREFVPVPYVVSGPGGQ